LTAAGIAAEVRKLNRRIKDVYGGVDVVEVDDQLAELIL
jgi:hypothetical protein